MIGTEPGSTVPPRTLLFGDPHDAALLAAELERMGGTLPARLNADPEGVERGLARLVLIVIDFLRRLLERQAIRRIEAGTVTDEEVERMGQTFLLLAAKVGELQEAFGLQDEDLNLSLGPLGDLL